MTTFKDKYGKWALITGASRGLGAEFAYQIAKKGLNTILVARDEKLLSEQKEKIEKNFNVKAISVPLDLSKETTLDSLIPVTKDLDVGLLINNAGISIVKPFLEMSEEELLEQFYINARAALILTRHYAGFMAKREKGGVIFLSSASALNGTAYSANYAGTKAYNLIMGESLWYELKKHGIDVLGFMPGCTWTPGFTQHEPQLNSLIKVMEVQETVKEALDSLGRRPSRLAGIRNRITYTFMGRMMTRRFAVNTVSRSMEKIFNPFKD